MRPQILIVLHQEHSSPGRVGHALEQLGFALDIRRPRFGDPLPQTLSRHAGAVIFGGPMSANDPDDFVKREIDWIKVPLAEGVPFLGICLGAQMLAKHLGAKVARHDEGRVEIGFHPIEPTEAGKGLLPCWPKHVYQWHNEGFDAPAGASVLASSEHFPVQMIKVGPAAYGLQFHPELTHAMRYKWCTRGAHRFSLPGAQDRETQIAGQWLHDPPLRQFLDDLLVVWQREIRPELRPKPVRPARPKRRAPLQFRPAWA